MCRAVHSGELYIGVYEISLHSSAMGDVCIAQQFSGFCTKREQGVHFVYEMHTLFVTL